MRLRIKGEEKDKKAITFHLQRSPDGKNVNLMARCGKEDVDDYYVLTLLELDNKVYLKPHDFLPEEYFHIVNGHEVFVSGKDAPCPEYCPEYKI